MKYHKLLARQIRRHLQNVSEIPASWQNLLKAINDSYDHFYHDRQLMDRSLEISSKELNSTNKLLLELNRQVKTKNEEILDSISYARMIQQALLPPQALLQKHLKEYFIYYRPRDIVSGDFYWLKKKGKALYFAAADCTGHGVPGAFMSIVGLNLLERAVEANEMVTPADMLDFVREAIKISLQQQDKNAQVSDGMDIALCLWEEEQNRLTFAGVENDLYLVRNRELIEYTADRYPIGSIFDFSAPPYTNHTIELQPGDKLYLFSDGYKDQFGGSKGKKFMSLRFKQLLIDIQTAPLSEQQKLLASHLEDWKGAYEQVDDILIMGIQLI